MSIPNLNSYSNVACPLLWVKDVKTGKVDGNSDLNVSVFDINDATKSNTLTFNGGNSTPSISFSGNGESVNTNVQIKNVEDPIDLNDVTNKKYVDNIFNSDLYKTSSTSGILLPSGNTSERPQDLQAGLIRWNTQLNRGELYDGSTWKGIVLLI